MRCAICGDQIDVSHPCVLPTTDGQYVHLMCAERDARVAARRRRAVAIITALFLVGVLVLSFLVGIEGRESLVALSLLLIGTHVFVNRRWWRYMIQRAQLWWRLGRIRR